MIARGDVLRAVIISLCVFLGSALAAMMIVAARRKVRTLVAGVPFGLQISFVFVYVLLYVTVAVGSWSNIGEPLTAVSVFSLVVMVMNAVAVWIILKEHPKAR